MIQKSNQRVLSLLMLFMLALTGSMEVKAQPSEWRGMTYNDDVRYSQWIINSRINDFRANSTSVGMGVFDANGEETTKPKGCKDNLDYVPGLVAKAIVENVKLNAAYSWAAPWYYSMKWFGNTYYNKFSSNATLGKSQDDLNGAKMFFALEDLTASGKFADATTNGHCITAMGTALGGLANLNSNYFIGNSSESAVSEKDAKDMGMYGGWFHKSTYVDEMWCDGLYMGPALLAQLINEYGNYSKINGNSGENDWDLITRLFTISWNQLYNSSNGLMYHAFAAASHPEYSATWTGYDPANGVYHSAAHWGRACGWYFLALVDILEQMQNAGLSSTANYEILKGYLNNLAAGLANYQDAETGCWYQVLDEKDSHLEGNYLESSCTAIFAAAYLKGTRLGYFTSNYSTVAKKAYKGCVNQFMMFDENNTAQLIHCCASAGLGKNNGKTRNGSRSYYIEGHDVTQRNSYTEGKVLGGFILAATEYERMYQSDKAILFSTDLKDSYSLENSGTISIEAFGADGANITYQWYRNGVAVDGATSATIAPTASGAYYCKATSGTTTIQSSTADVTVAGDDTFTPEFTTNLPATATATEGVAKTLTVAADHTDGYQWYSNTTASNTGGQPISGATEASYTFTPAATGTLYYYCVATNSKATGTKSVASSVCTVTVSEAPIPVTNYTVKFYDGDSQYGDAQTIEEGAIVETPALSPTKEGYTFKGWGLYNGSTARVLFPYEVWSNVNFYAVWSKIVEGATVEVKEVATIVSGGGCSSTVTPNTYSAAITTSGNTNSKTENLVSGYSYALKLESSSGKISIKIPENATNLSVVLLNKASDVSTLKLNTTATSVSWTAATGGGYTTTIEIADNLAGTTFDIEKGSGSPYINSITFNYSMPGSESTGGDNIVLDAASDYDSFEAYAGDNKTVTLRRNFTEGKWTTLVLPFSVTTEQLVAAFENASECELAKIKSMSVAQGKGSIHYTTVSSIEANKPVLAKIKPNESGKYVFTGVTVVAPTSVVSTSTDGKVEMHGVYKTTGYTQISSDSYFLSGGKFYDWSYLSNMSPFSAYILPVGENAQSVQSISFDDEETGVVNVNGNGNANENESYNLAGQRVTKEYNGIVIIKGKKVFTK